MEDSLLTRKLQMHNTIINHCENVWNTPQNMNYKVCVKYRPLEDAKDAYLVEKDYNKSLKMFHTLMDKQIPEAYGWYTAILVYETGNINDEYYEYAIRGMHLDDPYSSAWVLYHCNLRPWESFHSEAVKTHVLKLLEQSVTKSNNTCAKMLLGIFYNIIENNRNLGNLWYDEARKDGWPVDDRLATRSVFEC